MNIKPYQTKGTYHIYKMWFRSNLQLTPRQLHMYERLRVYIYTHKFQETKNIEQIPKCPKISEATFFHIAMKMTSDKFIINILGIYVPNSFRKSSVHLSHDSNSIFKHCLKVGFCSVRLIFFCSRLTMMIILALLMSQGHVNITGSLVILVARQQLWLLVRIVFFFQGKTLFLAIHCGELNTSYFP